MSTYLYRLARWCYTHRWATLAAWLVVIVAAVVISSASGGKTTDSLTIPGTEAQQVTSTLQEKLPAASGASTQVVFATPDADITLPKYQDAIASAVAALRNVDRAVSASNPVQSGAVSPDKHAALSTVTYDAEAADITDTTTDALDPAVEAARDAGIDVEFSGGVYPKAAHAASSEAIGIAVALVVLLLTFGSLVAAGLPILTALVGVIVASMGITALASLVDIASAATAVGTLLGLSCGIDYALFILTRHRGYVLDGYEPSDAAGRAAGTAGSSVVFAGLSVIIALCGLAVVGIPFLTVMGLAAAGTVAIALLVGLTLLPATFGMMGMRVARFSKLPVMRRAEKAVRAASDNPDQLAGSRWGRWVVKRRVPVLVGGLLLMGTLSIPLFSMELGLPGADSQPTSDTSRRAYDITSDHFGAGFNGTLTVLAENVTNDRQADIINNDLKALPGVASSSVSVVTNNIALISVVPTTGPADAATTELVQRIRDDRAAIKADSGAEVSVGGLTATNIDVSQKLSDALIPFLVTIVVLAFLLLTFAFRTILVPIKSIVGFLLSAGASLGVYVAVTQWGWGASLLGLEPTQTLSFLPVILLAILFGLSSDYEVFVVSRIKEHFTKTGDAREAVIVGTGQSARVVTAAALIMGAIFVSVLFAPDPTTKAIGLAFAIGVLFDAFIVRLALVPAAMAIVGSKIWYHPSWYSKYIPDPDIEGEKLDVRLRERGEMSSVS